MYDYNKLFLKHSALESEHTRVEVEVDLKKRSHNNIRSKMKSKEAPKGRYTDHQGTAKQRATWRTWQSRRMHNCQKDMHKWPRRASPLSRKQHNPSSD